MESLSSKVVEFPKTHIINNQISVDSSSFSKHDIIESNDGSGGGNMSYITREEFNAKMEVVGIKFEKLENKIDSASELILSETKRYLLENEKEQRSIHAENKKWLIGAVLIPTIALILSKINIGNIINIITKL